MAWSWLARRTTATTPQVSWALPLRAGPVFTSPERTLRVGSREQQGTKDLNHEGGPLARRRPSVSQHSSALPLPRLVLVQLGVAASADTRPRSTSNLITSEREGSRPVGLTPPRGASLAQPIREPRPRFSKSG